MSRFPDAGRVVLRANLGRSPIAQGLVTAAAASDLVGFDACGPAAVHDGFRPMVRDGAFDAGELAIGTALQALEHGRPLVLLPAVLAARDQHGSLGVSARRRPPRPTELEGRRVGVRSYAQTTAVWVRGILRHDCGVDPDRITWVTLEDGHVAECPDPPNCVRAAPGSRLDVMLAEGAVEAAVFGDLPSGVVPLLPDAATDAASWRAGHGGVPVNHVLAVHAGLAELRPDILREIWRLLGHAKRGTAPPSGGADPWPQGVEALRPMLDLFIGFALEQRLIVRPVAADALFGPFLRAMEA